LEGREHLREPGEHQKRNDLHIENRPSEFQGDSSVKEVIKEQRIFYRQWKNEPREDGKLKREITSREGIVVWRGETEKGKRM